MNNVKHRIYKDAGKPIQLLAFCIMLSLFFNMGTLNAQPNNKITGTVTDETGEAIVGASVMIKGTTIGTFTASDGTFLLNSDKPVEGTVIVASFLGMLPEEVTLKKSTSIEIILKDDTKLLDEVIVVGYGSQKAKEITGSVASVKMQELPATGAASVTQLLSGKAAGLYTNIASAQPGGKVHLRIRGEATGRSPLIIIDGFPISGFDNVSAGSLSGGETESVIASINPDDIQSIDILKDASATSIYGSKAAGGVILITTKRGKKQDKVKVDFNANVMFSQLYNMPELLDAQEYMIQSNRLLKELYMYDHQVGEYGDTPWESVASGFTPRFSAEEIQAYDGYKGTDWIDEISRLGIVQNYGLSLSGGSDKTMVYSSINYYNNRGVIKNNTYNKFIGKINVDHHFSKSLSGGLSVNFNRLDLSNIQLNGEAGDLSDIFRTAYSYAPICRVRDENGNYETMKGAAVLSNPVSMLDSKNLSVTDHLLANAFINWNIIDGLRLKGIVGADVYYGQASHYLPSTTLAGAALGGKAQKNLSTKNDYQAQLLLSYDKTIKNHSISAMAGLEFIQSNWSGFWASNSGFSTDIFSFNNLGMGGAKSRELGSWGGKSEALSFVARINYNYAERYMITANFRVDGSSNFAPNRQWGFFPGVSLGWDIAREPFMSSANRYVDQLKLRFGFGQTGNDNIGTAFANYYEPAGKVLWGDQIVSSIKLASLGNPDLKWETQTDYNVGIDFSFFNRRLSGSFEYFNRVISDLLGMRALSSTNEVTQIACNLDSKKQTYGYELSLNSVNFNNKNFKWNTSLTFSYYRDRWLKRDKNWKPDINDSEKAFFGEMWYYQSDGFFKKGDTFGTDASGEPVHMIPGTVKIKDVDSYLLDAEGNRVLDKNGKPQRSGKPDGRIDPADMVFLGVNAPFTIGFTNTFNFYNFDICLNLYGKFNFWRWNGTDQSLTNMRVMVDESLNLGTVSKSSWFSDNQQNAKYPSILQHKSKINGGIGDLYLEKAWYIRCQNIDFGYSFNFNKPYINKLRLYLSLQNPFIITPYKGQDPETNYRDTAYPNQRHYALGLQIQF